MADTIMAPSWGFKCLDKPLSSISGLFTPTASSESSITFFKSHATSPTRMATTYGRLSLLGLPSEVRDEIWQTVFDDITDSAGPSGWTQRPRTEYDGLSLTCRQVRDEISFFWPRTMIQHSRITTFVQPTMPTVGDFKKLSLEIPLSQNYQFFLAAAKSLKFLAPVLEDLRIFFVGSDKFRVRLSLETCGIHDVDIKFLLSRLAVDGQNHAIRQPLFVALRSLKNIRSLVLTNHNYPLLPKMVLENKPQLKKLHLLTDARTTVHKRHDMRSGGLNITMVKPLESRFPPVETLAISANASLNSIQLAGACTKHLRHLTWTVPDNSLQSSGGIDVNWYENTAHLLGILRMHSKQLKTLRMCFHEAIYEADPVSRTLYTAVERQLPHLPIDTLELHINSQSPWFGREVLRSLPLSLRRLYISRELIDEHLLMLDVDNQYMACKPTSDRKMPSRFVTTLDGTAQDAYIHVGEDKSRKDFISLGGGKLGFVGFEYEPTKPTMFGNSELRTAKAEDTRAWMLALNGRLLDRERNAHLANYDGGKHIPPSQLDSKACSNSTVDMTSIAIKSRTTVDSSSIAMKCGVMWVCAPPSLREREAAARELESSVIAKRTDYYFGNEDEATNTFFNEQNAQLKDLPELHWPDEVSMHSGEHWQTDDKPATWKEDGTEDVGSNRHTPKRAGNVGHSAWEQERMAHWIKEGTWYSGLNSFAKEEGREKFLADRAGPSLESLELK